MKTIWKYELDRAGATVLQMPAGATIIHVALQGTFICLWAIVDPRLPKEPRCISVYGTGNPLDQEARNHLGTVQEGPFVWHVFGEKRQ